MTYRSGQFGDPIFRNHPRGVTGEDLAVVPRHQAVHAARDLLGRAVEINAAFSVLYSAEAVTKLEALEGAVRR